MTEGTDPGSTLVDRDGHARAVIARMAAKGMRSGRNLRRVGNARHRGVTVVNAATIHHPPSVNLAVAGYGDGIVVRLGACAIDIDTQVPQDVWVNADGAVVRQVARRPADA